MAKLADMIDKISENVTEHYQKIEDKFTEKFLEEDGSLKTGKVGETVVDGFKKIEDGVVEGFQKMTDKIVEKVFAKEGESVEEAKARLNGEEKAD